MGPFGGSGLSVRNIGSVLDGKYQILSRLGTGGMGEVYRVRHLHLDELRVIKVLRQDLAGDVTLARRFQQEARTATQIKHSNVAILYDFSQLADSSYYMVWEHIDGQDVGTWLRDRGPFPSRLAVQLGIQALQGLDAIHGAGVIHRDISPDNLMITRDGKGRYLVKIIDLGLAKALETEAGAELTEAGSFLGKMRYCSPEQAGEGTGDLDQRSDLYSLAVVLYEMITGLPPFDSQSPRRIPPQTALRATPSLDRSQSRCRGARDPRPGGAQGARARPGESLSQCPRLHQLVGEGCRGIAAGGRNQGAGGPQADQDFGHRRALQGGKAAPYWRRSTRRPNGCAAAPECWRRPMPRSTRDNSSGHTIWSSGSRSRNRVSAAWRR